MDLTIAKNGLGHMPEQADPHPRNPINLPLIRHWKILYLCHRHDSGKTVEMPLHMKKYLVSLTSIWSPSSPHVPSFPIWVHRSRIWSIKIHMLIKLAHKKKIHIYEKTQKTEIIPISPHREPTGSGRSGSP